MRADLRGLDKKIQSSLEGLMPRLEALEKLATEPPVAPVLPAHSDHAELIQELKDNHLDPLHQRLILMEEKLERIVNSSEPQTDPWVLESIGKLDQRIGRVETRAP